MCNRRERGHVIQSFVKGKNFENNIVAAMSNYQSVINIHRAKYKTVEYADVS